MDEPPARLRVELTKSLGIVSGVYAFMAAFLSILAVVDLDAALFPTRYVTIDDVVAWGVLYLVVWAPAALAAAGAALGTFGVARRRWARSARSLAFTFGSSVTVGFGIVGIAVGVIAQDPGVLVVALIVAVAAGAVGYAAALTRALRVQAELDSQL